MTQMNEKAKTAEEPKPEETPCCPEMCREMMAGKLPDCCGSQMREMMSRGAPGDFAAKMREMMARFFTTEEAESKTEGA